MAAHPDFVPLLAARLHQVGGRAWAGPSDGPAYTRVEGTVPAQQQLGYCSGGGVGAWLPFCLGKHGWRPRQPPFPCKPANAHTHTHTHTPDFRRRSRRPQLCPLTVPKYAVFRSGSGQDEDAYLRQLGYMISADEDTGQVRGWRVAGTWLRRRRQPEQSAAARGASRSLVWLPLLAAPVQQMPRAASIRAPALPGCHARPPIP